MTWLWIILRCLFPRDPIRQGAEAIRQPVVQLVDIVSDDNWLPQLLSDPAFRLQVELAILDAEDCLRFWIAMRGCQISRIRLGVPHARATPNLTRAKDLPEIGAHDNKAIASLADLAPHIQQSGASQGYAHIQGGRPCVRTALYMAALSAVRCDARLKAEHQAMRAAGKPAKVALIAIARKLLVAANAMLKHDHPWSSQHQRS